MSRPRARNFEIFILVSFGVFTKKDDSHGKILRSNSNYFFQATASATSRATFAGFSEIMANVRVGRRDAGCASANRVRNRQALWPQAAMPFDTAA